ncbi:BURP domain protein RD22-like [Chenopodium quinoa]|uniref:BURP domain protein RD22-like n=1 Tax=Chenopodium quinoa TaxID=63459 RepID=UPI000B7706E3|nr:BURP domain protein RD22-like [Chenopodium quinoa]
MEFRLLSILAFLFIVLMVSEAALPPEIYWKKMLPNTEMPKAVKNSLPKPEWMEEESTSVNVGKGGVHVNTGSKQGGGTAVNVGPHKGVNVNTRKPNGHTNVNVGPKSGVGVHTGKPNGGHSDVHVGPKGGVRVHAKGANVGVGKGGVNVKAGPKKKPVYVGVHPGPDPFNYHYAASEAQLHDDPTKALFFLEKDMKVGQSMNLHFTRSTNAATFLPREEAKSLPFSSNETPAILKEFSVQPNSDEAKVIQETIKGCEEKGIQGEQKYCATSLESLVDYAKNSLGKNVKAMSTESKTIDDKVQKYTITAVKKVAYDNEAAVCHKQKYAYAVFYCHKTKDTSAYTVSLMGADGSKAKAMAVCHKDTSAWNPKHLAFQALNVKPGSVPVCHFLPEEHIVWVPNN